MKKLLTTISLILLIGCSSTTVIHPVLPDYQAVKPERPTLVKVEGNVPDGATDNLISLVSYIEKLEILLDGWDSFYTGLQEIYNDVSVK